MRELKDQERREVVRISGIAQDGDGATPLLLAASGASLQQNVRCVREQVVDLQRKYDK